MPACLIWSARPSSVTLDDFASVASRSFILRYCAMPFALSRSLTTRKVSPASGIASRPRISTGVDGPAISIARPRSSNIARILPKVLPTMNESPDFKVPFCTSTDATAPRPRSSLASTTVPTADRPGVAFRLATSAVRVMFSSSRSRFMRFFADTSTKIVSPPQTSGTTPRSPSCFITRAASASGLSILLTATMIGTFAAFA